MEQISNEERKAAMATMIITLASGTVDKNDRFINDEEIIEDMIGYAVKDAVLFIMRADNSTVGIPLDCIVRFERKENVYGA